MTTTTRLLTAPQVATRLGVSVRTVRRMADDGRLPHVGKLPGLTGPYLFEPGVIDVVARQRQEASA